jgi:hypothetical protein
VLQNLAAPPGAAVGAEAFKFSTVSKLAARVQLSSTFRFTMRRVRARTARIGPVESVGRQPSMVCFVACPVRRVPRTGFASPIRGRQMPAAATVSFTCRRHPATAVEQLVRMPKDVRHC